MREQGAVDALAMALDGRTTAELAPIHAGGEGTTPTAASSSNIAVAARRFGDDYPSVHGQWRLRAAGLLLVAATVLYLPWMLASLNGSALWIAVPFAVANVFSVAYSMLSVVNAWSRRVPPRAPLAHGSEPAVGVIIPTCGESVPMILRTVTSVLEQDWPLDKLVVIVSDDGADPRLEAAVTDLPVRYVSPPPINAPGRDGAAKAGNLNAALAVLDAEHPEIVYVETRDADDEMGTTSFLREVVGQLERDPGLAFVQTIKEAQVSAGDPFNNRESMFYRGQMLARNATNSVFPCGSGVVWRRTALRSIGEFPTWNLVEDLQSGVEALRRGWRGMYLPIVGAVGQHAPEDLPNVYKQRGTWAIDTVRLMVWGNLKGLGLRQRLQFAEMLMFYLNAFTVLVYVPSIAAALVGHGPLDSTGMRYLLYMVPLMVATELWLLAAFWPYNDRRTRQRRYLRSLWLVRIMWSGMAPIYMMATVQAVVSGRNRKPTYRVTRKYHDIRWHWRHTLPQTALLGVVVVALLARLGSLPSFSLLAVALYWGGLNCTLLLGFISRGWHGVSQRKHARSVGSATVAEATTAAPGFTSLAR